MPRIILFQPAARYPADPRVVFILALSVFSGLASLAVDQGPGTLEELLPKWGIITWGLTLCIGSAITLLGLTRQTVNGIITEQVGSVAVGAATVFYSILALWVAGPPAFQAIGIILAWGLACFARWVQLQLLLVKMNHDKIIAETILAIPTVGKAGERTAEDIEDIAEGHRIEDAK